MPELKKNNFSGPLMSRKMDSGRVKRIYLLVHRKGEEKN